MASLAQRRRAATLAALAAAAAGAPPAGVAADMPETGEGASEYRALVAVLHDNLRTLAEIQSVDARNPKKAEMATAFDAWLTGVLEAGKQGQAAQDEILVTMLVWAIDCRAIDRALDLAEHAIAHGLAMPERYKRSAACVTAEDIATLAIDHPEAVSHAQLLRTAELTETSDMPDQARAKLFKALGRASAAAADTFDPQADNAVAGGQAALLTAALGWYQRALGLNRNVGVKKEIDAVERALKTLEPARPE